MQVETRALLKIGLIANLFEWYEFSIYGYLAAILGRLFFEPPQSSIHSLIQVFGIFTASYLIRPIGSLFFGVIGDRMGRSYSLRLSLLIMSVPTVLIGMLPVYSEIGGIATACLLSLRLVQGFAAGGERPVLGCYIFENAQPSRRGFLCSTVIVSTSIGMLSGSLVFNVLGWCFTEAVILEWAWRIPFLLGFPITLYIFYARQKLFEAQVFSDISTDVPKQSPILSVLLQAKKPLLQSIVLIAFPITAFYILAIWMPLYLVYFLGYPQTIASLSNIVTLCAMVFFYLIAGYLSDFLGYKRLMLVSSIMILLSIYPIFWMLQNGSYSLLLGSQLLYGFLLSGIDALSISYLGDVFPKAIRCSGMALSHSLASALFGGITPLVCTYLTYKTQLLTFPALYIIALGLLALPIVLRLRTAKLSIN